MFAAAQISTIAQAQSESVNPGINASYLKEDLIVEEWIERLEREGREVFDNRDVIVDRLGLKPGMDVVDVRAGKGSSPDVHCRVSTQLHPRICSKPPTALNLPFARYEFYDIYGLT